MQIRKWLWRGAAALAAATAVAGGAVQASTPERPAPAASAATPAAAAERVPRPALWLLEDEDTRIYLFGTVHVLPEGVDWNRGAVAEAYAAADELVMEADVGAVTAGEWLTALVGTMATDLPPLLERVPPERRERLRELVEASSLPMSVYDRMKTWAAAFTLGYSRLEETGIRSSNGVETGLSAQWPRGERPVIGLERAAEQNAMLSALSEETQREWLASVADDEEEEAREFEALLEAWTSGDVTTLARISLDEEEDSPELREVILTRRNARWVEWLRSRLERPGTVFFAVGAAHLAGQDSVQDMLARAGLRTERVQ